MTDYEQKIRDKFPNLQYSEFKVVDNRQERFGIDDLSYKNPICQPEFKEARELFILACRGYINFYTAQELARPMNRLLEIILERLDPGRTVLVFPGNGAKVTKDLLPKPVLESFQGLDLDVCRKVLPDMSIAGVDILTPNVTIRKALPKGIESIVLIDDVVGSRATSLAVRATMDRGENYDWYAASWMTLSPLQVRGKKDDQFGSGVLGFRKVVSSLIYQGESGTPANNSLSSFISTDPKSESVIARYRDRFVDDEEAFNEAINTIGRLTNGQS